MNDQILEFIKRRFPENNGNWLNGNCFWFANILQTRFPEGEIWYEPIEGHFLFKYCEIFYDWTGIYLKDISKASSLSSIKNEDILLYNRLIRDCVL